MARTANPLPMVLPIWENDWSVFPDVVRVSMEDGHVLNYRLEVSQPKPVFRDKLDQFTQTCVGYRAKRRRRA